MPAAAAPLPGLRRPGKPPRTGPAEVALSRHWQLQLPGYSDGWSDWTNYCIISDYFNHFPHFLGCSWRETKNWVDILAHFAGSISCVTMAEASTTSQELMNQVSKLQVIHE